jgi:hypothetical protein
MTKLIDYNNNNSDENVEVDKISDLAIDLIEQKKKVVVKNNYSDEEKKCVLALSSLSYSMGDISKITGVPKSTIHAWVNGQGGVDSIDYQDVSDRLKANLQSRLTASASKFLSLAHEKAHKASFKDLMIGSGIALEKEALLGGNATHRVEHVTKKIDVINVSKTELTDKRRYLESELTDLKEDG